MAGSGGAIARVTKAGEVTEVDVPTAAPVDPESLGHRRRPGREHVVHRQQHPRANRPDHAAAARARPDGRPGHHDLRAPPRQGAAELASHPLPVRIRAHERVRLGRAERIRGQLLRPAHRNGRGRRAQPGHPVPLPARRLERRRHDTRTRPDVRDRGAPRRGPQRASAAGAQGRARLRRERGRRAGGHGAGQDPRRRVGAAPLGTPSCRSAPRSTPAAGGWRSAAATAAARLRHLRRRGVLGAPAALRMRTRGRVPARRQLQELPAPRRPEPPCERDRVGRALQGGAQALGPRPRRELPQPRPPQPRDRARHALADIGPLRRHAHPRHERLGRGSRLARRRTAVVRTGRSHLAKSRKALRREQRLRRRRL
jgi:hypothetical protein